MKSYKSFNYIKPTFTYILLIITISTYANTKNNSLQTYAVSQETILAIQNFHSDKTVKENFYCKVKPSSPSLPPYKSFWFKVAILILLLVLIHLSIKLRLRLIRFKNKVLAEKIQEHTIQLNHTIKELRRAKEKLSIQNESQKLLMASISHDIRNPLSFIVYISKESYENFNMSPELEINFKSIYTSSTQLMEFVTTLLNYTKAYKGDYSDAPVKKVNLYHLINSKVTLFKNIAEHQKTSIQIEVSSDTGIIINREFLSIVLHNLIDNSLKNTYSGKIKISCYKELNLLFLIIADTGTGMSAETLAYYRSYQSGTTDLESVKMQKGLGIKIVFQLLAIMDGELKIESRLGHGTKITLIFKTD